MKKYDPKLSQRKSIHLRETLNQMNLNEIIRKINKETDYEVSKNGKVYEIHKKDQLNFSKVFETRNKWQLINFYRNLIYPNI